MRSVARAAISLAAFATVVVSAGRAHTAPLAETVTAAAVATVPAVRHHDPALGRIAVPARPIRILVVGDSTAWTLGIGLVAWAQAHPQHADVQLAVSPGCGFVRGNFFPDETPPFGPNCDVLLDHELPRRIAELRPDVVMLMVTSRDLENRAWSEAEGVLTPFDPRYRARILDGYRHITQRLRTSGVSTIAWVHAPFPAVFLLADRIHMTDPRRYDVQRGVIDQVAAENPGLIDVIDLDTWMLDRQMIHDVRVRPDGLHFTPASALDVSERMVGPSLLMAALT